MANVPVRINAIAGLGYVFISNSLKARILRPFLKLVLNWVLNDRKSFLILQNGEDLKVIKSSRSQLENRVRLIKGSGVDTKRFYPLTLKDRKVGSETKVLLASRLLWDKGIREFVEAAYKFHEQNIPIRFLLAGAPDFGNPGAVQVPELEKWKDEGVIDILGQVDDMPELLRLVDIFVLPTSYGEGLPKSLIEAAATALPLIATDVPGCREVVVDGVNGLLIPPKNPKALCDAILALHNDPLRAKKMGQLALEKVLSEFDEEIVIRQTLQVYGEL